MPENLIVAYIDKPDSPKAIHCVGTGKAIPARNFDVLRSQVIGQLSRHTELTQTSMTQLGADIDETLQRGYAIDNGEFRERILSFGAAITLLSGEATAALGVSLPEVNIPEKAAEWLGWLVVHNAISVTSKLRRT